MKILCEKCGKPVDEIIETDDPISCHKIIKVKCHGEYDQMKLSMVDIVNMTEFQINDIKNQVGVAFRNNLIQQHKMLTTK